MAGATRRVVILNPLVEVICRDKEGKTRTKYYRSLAQSKRDFDKIESLGCAVRRQGYLYGADWEKEEFGDTTDFNEMAITLLVEFQTASKKFTCRYLAHKYPKRLTENVRQPKAIRIGRIVKVERKTPDELEAERVELGFERYRFWEDVIVKELPQKKNIFPNMSTIDFDDDMFLGLLMNG